MHIDSPSVNVSYIDRNGNRTEVQGKVGDNLMYLSHRHGIEMEGMCCLLDKCIRTYKKVCLLGTPSSRCKLQLKAPKIILAYKLDFLNLKELQHFKEKNVQSKELLHFFSPPRYISLLKNRYSCR